MSQSLRWVVKKVARRFVAATGTVLPSASQRQPESIRALTYHRFGEAQQDAFCVTPAMFEAQLQLLARENRAVSLQQVIDHVVDGQAIPEHACLVTIDDGMLSTLTIALPLLEKYNVPAVAFVSSNLIGLDIDEAEERYLTWPELNELALSGLVEIGSHAHTHRSVARLSPEERVHEACESRRLLSENLNSDVRSFAYPFGMLSDHNEQTDQVLRQAGYTIAFNSMHGSIHHLMDPVSLPRVKVEGGESLAMFEAVSRGGMDRWRLIDDRLWRLQLVRQEIT